MHYQEDYERATTLYDQCLVMFRELGDEDGVASTLNGLGVLARNRGDLSQAWALYEESLGIFRRLGDKWRVALLLSNLARVARDEGDWNRTRTLCAESLALFEELGHRQGVAWVVNTLATMAQARHDAERAARLFGMVATLSETIGLSSLSLSPAESRASEEAAAAARAELGDLAFTAAWTAGRAMPFAQAVEYALASESPVPSSSRSGTAPPISAQSDPLTRREREVAVLLARGLTNRQIAQELVISEKTVGIHVEHILAKLGFRSRAQVAAWAAERGLVSSESP